MFSSKRDDFGRVLDSTSVSSVNYGHHGGCFSSIPDSTFNLRYFSNNISTGILTVVLYRYFKYDRTVPLISKDTGRIINLASEM